MLSAKELISRYHLQPHPEGGYYAQTYKSEETIAATALSNRFTGDRNLSTAIYFLLEQKDFSAFHRIKSDELWHFYAGGGLHIYVIHPDGKGEELKLGDDIQNGYSFQQCVPAGCWFASAPINVDSFSFVGCTVSPGFNFDDFELAEKELLIEKFPHYKGWINKLCRK